MALIDAPWSVDANGDDVPTRYEIDGTTLIQHADHKAGSFAYPIMADPSIFFYVTCATAIAIFIVENGPGKLFKRGIAGADTLVKLLESKGQQGERAQVPSVRAERQEWHRQHRQQVPSGIVPVVSSTIPGARLRDPQLRRVLTVGATMLGGFLDISLCAYAMADQTFAAAIAWGTLGALVGGLLYIGLARMGTASDSNDVSAGGDLAERFARFEEASSADHSSSGSDPRAVRWGWNALLVGGALASFLVLTILVSLKSIATVVVFAAVSSAPVLGVDTAIVLAISVGVQALVGYFVFERIADRYGITI